MERPVHSIYIVDDDPDDRQIIHHAFLESSAKINYVFVESGNHLLDILDKPGAITPALILLDLNMPGLSGLQVLKILKQSKKTSSIPVVVFTTSVLPTDKTLSYELGANCFITKPDSFSELMQITYSILLLWFRHLLVTSDGKVAVK